MTAMADNYKRVSDDAVREATGKGWNEWFALLDESGADSMSHKAIAAMLATPDHLGPDGRWWAQTITVAYEHARGRREVGQTAGAGYEIGVQKTLPITAARLWQLLVSAEGMRIWLGDVEEAFPLQPGLTYETRDGVSGEVRTVSPGEKLRLTWKPVYLKSPSTLQIYLEAKGDRTALRFHQEKLVDSEERALMKNHWRNVLKALSASI